MLPDSDPGHLEIYYNSQCGVVRETAFSSQPLGVWHSWTKGSSVQGLCSSVLRSRVQKTTQLFGGDRAQRGQNSECCLEGSVGLETGEETWGLEEESIMRCHDFPWMCREMVSHLFFFNLPEAILMPGQMEPCKLQTEHGWLCLSECSR